MSVEHPIVLILEDSAITGARIERAILEHLPRCRPIWARTIAETQSRTMGFDIDLFLIDVELPDGNGLDFLSEMIEVQPAAHAMVMTANRIPEYKERAQSRGLVFVEKPLDMRLLTELLKSIFWTETASHGAAFSAALRDLTPADIIQMKCLSGATAILDFQTMKNTGRVYFRNGDVIHAEVGEKVGEDAFRQIFGWKQGRATERTVRTDDVARTINVSWQGLLMNAAQAADEGSPA